MEKLKEHVKEILKNRKALILIVSVLVLVLTLTISYAFFSSTNDNTKKQEAELKTGTMILRFADNDGGISATLDFGKSVTKDFLIENLGTLDATANMYWRDLTNTYLEQSLTYKLEYKTSPESTDYIEIPVSSPNVPRSEVPTSELLAEELTIPAKTTYYYRLTITLEHLDDVNQTQDINARLSTWFDLKEGNKAIEKVNTLQVVGESYSEKMWEYSYNITKVIFENTMNAPSNYAYSYDISNDGDNSVMAYLVTDETDTSMYTAHIQADGTIYANPDSSYLFSCFYNLKSIEGLEYFDTSNVTDMQGMFWGCSNLTTLNLSNFDTSNVTSTYYMFCDCSSLTTLDLSSFNTSNVTNMSSMFNACSNLTSLDLSNFDTSNVTDMLQMFKECLSLTSLDLSNFDTSNVTSMSYIFNHCSSLTTLNLSNFDTSNVTDMQGMFYGCSSLTSLDLSNFDTSNVTSTYYMFCDCSSLTTLDLSSFNTSNVTDMSIIFYGCSSLTNLNLSNWNISSVTEYSYMFSDVPSSIKITVNSNEMKNWLIDKQDMSSSEIILQTA